MCRLRGGSRVAWVPHPSFAAVWVPHPSFAAAVCGGRRVGSIPPLLSHAAALPPPSSALRTAALNQTLHEIIDIREIHLVVPVDVSEQIVARRIF